MSTKQMKKSHFNLQLQFKESTTELFKKLCMISEWWSTDWEGACEKLNDEFTVHFGASFVNFEVVEIVPENNMIWMVKNCYWAFLENKADWNGTVIIWEITSKGVISQLSLTHVGLVPGKECYDICREGWGLYAGNSLYRLITEGQGIPFETNKQLNRKQ
jgi:hypothetical protein